MDVPSARKPFNKRAFLSVALAASGLVLPISGYMNHLLQFAPLTVERHFWMSLHNGSAILFAVCAILHIVLNWKSLRLYLRRAGTVMISREAFAALALLLAFVGLISSHAFHVQ